jgi:hypothetical protein
MSVYLAISTPQMKLNQMLLLVLISIYMSTMNMQIDAIKYFIYFKFHSKEKLINLSKILLKICLGMHPFSKTSDSSIQMRIKM